MVGNSTDNDDYDDDVIPTTIWIRVGQRGSISCGSSACRLVDVYTLSTLAVRCRTSSGWNKLCNDTKSEQDWKNGKSFFDICNGLIS